MTDLAKTALGIRIARVLTGMSLSPNADGDPTSRDGVADQVDATWRGEVETARAVLRSIREPTEAMIEAGSEAGGGPVEVWSAMVRVAIDEADLEGPSGNHEARLI